MKNTAEVHSDNNTVYLVSTMNPSGSRRIMLSIITFGLTLLYVWFWWEVEHHHLKRLFIPTAVSSIVFIFIPWRYWLWNFFGQEKLTINAQTLSHMYDYKIVRMNRNTIAHKKLTTNYEFVKKIGDEDFGYLSFMSLNDKTNQPEEIYQTGVLISKADLARVQEMVGGVVGA